MDGYWYAIRQKGGGNLLLEGPFTYEKCKSERKKSKLNLPDFEVSTPFIAASRNEATVKASVFMP